MPLSSNQIPLKVASTQNFNAHFAALSQCNTCKIKLHAFNANSDVMWKMGEYILFGDNPNTTLRVNGVDYHFHAGLIGRIGHILSQDYSAEVLFIFTKFIKGNTVEYALAIPLIIGEGPGSTYFSGIGTIANRPPITSFFKNPKSASFLTYKKIINESDSRSFSCIVSTKPAYIRQLDYTRLEISKLIVRLDRVPVDISPTSSYANDITRIKGIRLEDADSAARARNPASADYVPTSQVKCRPLDPSRDIKGDSLYVGGHEMPGDTTLAEEMSRAVSTIGTAPDSTISVSSVESVVGIVIGVIIGTIVLLLVFSFFYKKSMLNWMMPSKLKKVVATVGAAATAAGAATAATAAGAATAATP